MRASEEAVKALELMPVGLLDHELSDKAILENIALLVLDGIKLSSH